MRKFLKNLKHADQNKAVQGGNFFSKLINHCRTNTNSHAGEFFLKNNKRADQNKAMQGDFFSQN